MGVLRFHIIIDVHNITNSTLTDKVGLEKFLLELPSQIGMNILCGPIVTHGIPHNPGLSGFVLIDYSHISVHTFSQTKQALIDIFSCKKYDQKKVTQSVLNYFQVDKSQAQIQQVAWE